MPTTALLLVGGLYASAAVAGLLVVHTSARAFVQLRNEHLLFTLLGFAFVLLGVGWRYAVLYATETDVSVYHLIEPTFFLLGFVAFLVSFKR